MRRNAATQAVTPGGQQSRRSCAELHLSDRRPRLTENSGAGQAIYTAVADDRARRQSPARSATAWRQRCGGVQHRQQHRRVTLTGNPNYEGQAELQLHGAGHRSASMPRREVTLAVTNLDEVCAEHHLCTVATAIVPRTAARARRSTPRWPTTALDVSAGRSASAWRAPMRRPSAIDSSTGAVTLTGNPNYEPSRATASR